MWIRSQDKQNIVKIQAVNINYNQPGQILGWISPFDTADYTSCFILGDYKTDERAIKVLDDIQEKIPSNIKYTPVYQMPER